jgi:hypothetical protein
MDRSLIKDELTRYGFADNTVGLTLHGRPHAGRYEWYLGIYDDVNFENFVNDSRRSSDKLMPAGRFVINFLDPAQPPQGYADYRGSYLGEGERLALGMNAGYLDDAIDNGGISAIYACGVDLFFNKGPWVAQGEYDWIAENFDDDINFDIRAEGWYVQTGYMLTRCWELAGRFQIVDQDVNVPGNIRRWTSIGLNYYIWDHNFKVQTEYTFREGQSDDLRDNVVQCQLQLDF